VREFPFFKGRLESRVIAQLLFTRIAGVGMFVCTFIYMCAWVYTSEVTAKRIRERYLRAILRQDIAFFDTVGPGEVTTRIQTDTRM
jgi:ATP-binding cassette subfamily B (MDR/TAP) protein 1